MPDFKVGDYVCSHLEVDLAKVLMINGNSISILLLIFEQEIKTCYVNKTYLLPNNIYNFKKVDWR